VAEPAPARVVVIGVGNPDRGDDGVGRLAAQVLRARLPPAVAVLDHAGEAAQILAWLGEADTAFCIDAACSGAAPGTVRRLDAAAAPLPASILAVSTHGMGLGEAIELARALGQLPQRCVVYAIEGRSFAAGAPLSPEVERAAGEVAARIAAELAEAVAA
jgi:hydrogenase maturation protease